MYKKIGGRIPQVKVDKENGVVVAYLDNCRYDAISAIFRQTEVDYILDDATIRPALMNNTYRGKAKLYPGDTFNEKEGKEIALKRLQEKYDAAREKAVKRFFQRWERVALN